MVLVCVSWCSFYPDRRVEPCLLFVFSTLAVRLLPFTVTKLVTIQEMSKVVGPRGTRLAFGKIFVKEGSLVSILSPHDCGRPGSST